MSHQPSEEELRAAYEAEIKRLRVEDMLVQTVVSLINLGGRKAGLAQGTEDERDATQLGQAIEGVRALLPLVEPKIELREASQIRQALSQLQMAYAQLAGPGAGGEQEGAGEPPQPPGGQTAPPAGQQPPREQQPRQGSPRSSGRLWIPGQ